MFPAHFIDMSLGIEVSDMFVFMTVSLPKDLRKSQSVCVCAHACNVVVKLTCNYLENIPAHKFTN